MADETGKPTSINIEHASINVASGGGLNATTGGASSAEVKIDTGKALGGLQDLQDKFKKLEADGAKFQSALTKLGPSTDKVILAPLKAQLDSINKAKDDIQKVINKPNASPAEIKKGEGAYDKIKLGMLSAAGATKLSLGQMAESVNKVMKEMGPLGNMIGAAGPFYAAKGFKAGLDILNNWSDGVLDAEKTARDFAKDIEQMGMSMGVPFDKAASSVDDYTQKYKQTMQTTRASKEVIEGVQKAFKNMIDPTAQVEKIKKLQGSMGSLQSTLNLTNVAILTGAANGMEASKAAGWMATSMTELGASSDVAAMSMGKIGWAAKNSGLGFEKVGDAIMASADSLKMFGGTVNSVAPLYKAFSDSLTKGGAGRQGLTPELFQSFVGGIKQMSLATRALFGMQLPGMAQKGALGAGLEMEAAMEDKTGGGMKKIAESITATLKGIGGGGGKVLTREEAMKTGQQQQFLQQRGIIQQQLGISDTGTANKMMEMLQSLDKNGLDIGSDQADSLKEMMTSGEKLNQKNQSLKDVADNALQQATIDSGDKIVDAIGDLAKKIGLEPITSLVKKEALSGFADADIKKLSEKLSKAKAEEKPKTALEKRTAQLNSYIQQNPGILAQQRTQAIPQQMSQKLGIPTKEEYRAYKGKGGTEKYSEYMKNRNEADLAQMMGQGVPVRNLPTADVIRQKTSTPKAGTIAAPAAGPQAITKNIDVGVNLKAHVKGTSIVIDIEPAVQKAMKNIMAHGEGMAR